MLRFPTARVLRALARQERALRDMSPSPLASTQTGMGLDQRLNGWARQECGQRMEQAIKTESDKDETLRRLNQSPPTPYPRNRALVIDARKRQMSAGHLSILDWRRWSVSGGVGTDQHDSHSGYLVQPRITRRCDGISSASCLERRESKPPSRRRHRAQGSPESRRSMGCR
jgi:hypothetical protein